jgi:preprotein translocase subunit YajC
VPEHLMFSILAQQGQGNILTLILPFALLFLLMWLLFIRPQRKQEMQRKMMLASIRKNDRVMTNGGLYGVVTNIKDEELTLKIDEARDVKVRVSRNFIASVIRKEDEEDS